MKTKDTGQLIFFQFADEWDSRARATLGPLHTALTYNNCKELQDRPDIKQQQQQHQNPFAEKKDPPTTMGTETFQWKWTAEDIKGVVADVTPPGEATETFIGDMTRLTASFRL